MKKTPSIRVEVLLLLIQIIVQLILHVIDVIVDSINLLAGQSLFLLKLSLDVQLLESILLLNNSNLLLIALLNLL